MFKTEMTQQQLEARCLFVDKLSVAGWNPGRWDILFEQGHCLTPEAQAEYQNSAFNFRLSYFIKEAYILLNLVERNNGSFRAKLRLYPKRELNEVLDAIIKRQSIISIKSYASFVSSLIPLCEHLLLEMPNGLMKVS
jgi:hypothetical protein